MFRLDWPIVDAELLIELSFFHKPEKFAYDPIADSLCIGVSGNRSLEVIGDISAAGKQLGLVGGKAILRHKTHSSDVRKLRQSGTDLLNPFFIKIER